MQTLLTANFSGSIIKKCDVCYIHYLQCDPNSWLQLCNMASTLKFIGHAWGNRGSSQWYTRKASGTIMATRARTTHIRRKSLLSEMRSTLRIIDQPMSTPDRSIFWMQSPSQIKQLTTQHRSLIWVYTNIYNLLSLHVDYYNACIIAHLSATSETYK